ncbi:Zn-dependent hydrolase [Photobacterium aquae]|uniref:Zn-dependent hydrolase n=1 Tax=Photobacterium aquae TaxID=1195763 RepID=A0A0J1JXA8_9GAMM|nr:MBL fold metallo-hydrolase [Photobacterium aquae]KLV06927.1 Zn-dependent hydrolase [Photobacterium aquae]
MLALHQIQGYIQTIYLAEYQHGLLLLDSGCYADVPTICNFIETQLKRPVHDLKLTVVTHMHPDHAGGAAKLRQVTGCSIAMCRIKKHWYQGIDGKLMFLTDILLAKWVAKRLKRPTKRLLFSPWLKADFLLDDNEYLPYFPDWKVLFTQGHTDRDLSLYHLPLNRIYVADLMVKVKEHYIPPYPIFHPNRYRASLERIFHLAPSSLLLAHGGEIRPSQSIQTHILTLIPHKPITHWHSVKSKLFKVYHSLGFK